MRIPLPESLRPPSSDNRQVATPRDAATIALVRDGERGLETYLLRRRSTLEFAPGVLVFPGGGVHDADRQLTRWIGPEPAVWADRFGCDEDTARGLVVAAVRETYEESGVLFASGTDGEPVMDDMAGLVAERHALDRRELDFGEFLAAHGLFLRADMLGAWAHWVTPAFEPKRFDTRFFVAALPAGQQTGDLPGEAERAEWWPIRDIWAELESGSSMMLPPTSVTCSELEGLTVAELPSVVAERVFRRIEPQLVDVDGQLFLDYALETP
jgi:8-oxo-dGTP pyrophosphatase MutT (NUDIX family)